MPEGDLVNNGQGGGEQSQDLQAGSSYVENVRINDKKVTLMQLKKNVEDELGEKYWPEIFMTDEDLEEKTGITKEMYEEFLAQTQIINANIDMMIIIRA